MKSKAYEDSKILSELITRVLCDMEPSINKVDAAYLFAETFDNEESIFPAAEMLWNSRKIKRVCISNEGKKHGYEGFKHWEKNLVKRGIPSKCIIGIPRTPEIPPSTDAEATGLIRYINAQKWKNIYIIAQPLHQLRSFVSCVSAISREKSKVGIFNFVGFVQNWGKRVVHSQGIQRGYRSNLIRMELKKIMRYYNAGKLVSPSEALLYMNKRNKLTN